MSLFVLQTLALKILIFDVSLCNVFTIYHLRHTGEEAQVIFTNNVGCAKIDY